MRLMDDSPLERKGYSVAALRALAHKELPRMLFDMVDGAAGDEITLRNNEAALAAIELVPNLLAGAPKRDQSVELFGVRLPSPVIIGPTGLAGLLWPHAELATARAAARFGTIYCTSHASTATHRGDRRRDAGAEMDAGLSLQGSRPNRRIRRSRRSGRLQGSHPHCRQSGDGGARPRRAQRHELSVALGPRSIGDFLSHPAWLLRMRETPSPTFVNYGARTSIGAFGAADERAARPGRHLERRRLAARAMARAAAPQGSVAPGRGARGDQSRRRCASSSPTMAGASSTARSRRSARCRAIVEAVGGRAPVLVDGGFRRGIDVVKALALGARAVMIGRPHLWGVACAGEDGVSLGLELFRREIDRALALGGWDGIAKLDRECFPGQAGRRTFVP